jgi:hypothetical protein
MNLIQKCTTAVAHPIAAHKELKMKNYSADEVNKLANVVYLQNKKVGWWDNPNRCIYQTLQLVNTEIAEATEGDRKSLMDDKLPHRVMAEVEIADTLIRLADLAGRYGWRYDGNVPASLHLNQVDNTGARHLVATMAVCDLAKELFIQKSRHTSSAYTIGVLYSVAVSTLLEIAKIENYDLVGAVQEKLAFNANREDHKRENRQKENGKAY